VAACAGGVVLAVGCAPAGGPIAREDVVEIETIEMAPAADKAPSPAAETARAIDASREVVDARTAAADEAIAAAAQPAPPPAAVAASTPGATPAAEKPPLATPATEPTSQQPSETVQLGDPALTAGVPASLMRATRSPAASRASTSWLACASLWACSAISASPGRCSP
jgi:translation initiation factor IF-2